MITSYESIFFNLQGYYNLPVTSEPCTILQLFLIGYFNLPVASESCAKNTALANDTIDSFHI